MSGSAPGLDGVYIESLDPDDVVVDVLRETGRRVFLRGLVEQDGEAAVAFSGTIRKASER